MTQPPLSPSQLQRHAACPAQWGAVYLEKIREPDTDATLRGKEVHAQLEGWVRDGVLPTSKIALAGLPHAPPPGTPGVTVERALAFNTPSSPFRGFVDLERVFSEEVVKLQDWKTTTKIANAKTIDYLVNHDLQSNLYAYEAFQRGFTSVMGSWVYLLTCGTPKAIPVNFNFERQKTVDMVEGPVDTQAREIQTLYQLRPKWTELEKKTGHCYAYNRQCHVFESCKPNRQISIAMGAQQMKQDFRAAMSAQFPGSAPPAPPPPAPSAPLPPPAPPAPNFWVPGQPMNAAQEMLAGVGKPLWLIASAADVPPSTEMAMGWPGAQAPYSGRANPPPAPPAPAALPPTDRGFVNPPEAPATPSPSPEAAAVRQGITPPAPAVQDDLDALDRDALKALAVSLGAVPANTRAREVALRESIRSVRNGGPTVHTAPPPPDSALVPPEAPAPKAVDVVPPPSGPITVSFAPPTAPAPAAFGTPRVAEPSDYSKGAAPGGQDFCLFINCAPARSDSFKVLSQALLLEAAHNVIREEKPQIQDYRQIQYTALADLNLAVRAVLDNGGYVSSFNAIVVDTRTPDGAAIVTTIEAKAADIVRGF